jgi:hypothetical protein
VLRRRRLLRHDLSLARRHLPAPAGLRLIRFTTNTTRVS